MRHRFSEREKLYWMSILFPIFWPFLIYLIAEDLCRGLGKLVRTAWSWITPRCSHEGDVLDIRHYTEREDHPGGPPCNEMLLVTYKTTVRSCRKCGETYAITTSSYS